MLHYSCQSTTQPTGYRKSEGQARLNDHERRNDYYRPDENE